MAAFLALVFAAVTWSGTVVTADEQGHSISIVDAAASRVHTVHVSVAPHNVQTSADRRYLYATGIPAMDMSHMGAAHMSEPEMAEMMEGSGFLLGFDLLYPDAAPFSIALGKHPAHVVVDAANRFAYVTVTGEDAVKVVDLHRKAVAATIPAGKMPHGLRMSPDERTIYVADMGGGTVSFIDVAERRLVANVFVGKTPVQVAVAPDGKTVYATIAGENAVAAIDVAARTRRNVIQVGPNPMQLAVSPDGTRIYVAGQGTKAIPGHTVSVIDTASETVVATVQVPAGAHGVVVAPDGSTVFVTDAFDSKLSEIDARTLSVRSISVGEGPNGVTLGP
ncbi:MAG TPA: YncE family protein [Candidatus Baltobacteraceae bacterium]|nr:YncE family protein [Candidatus Baltobacteraceae bacterium]